MLFRSDAIKVKVGVSIDEEFSDLSLDKLCKTLKLNNISSEALKSLTKNSLKLFTENDLSLLEINPLVISKDMNLIALDCKMTIDSNALFKHPHVIDLQDWTQIDCLIQKQETSLKNFFTEKIH